MRVVIEPAAELHRLAARRIAQALRAKPGCVLGLAAGRTMMPLYDELVRLHAAEGLTFAAALAHSYARRSAVVRGNVVLANHGETRKRTLPDGLEVDQGLDPLDPLDDVCDWPIVGTTPAAGPGGPAFAPSSVAVSFDGLLEGPVVRDYQFDADADGLPDAFSALVTVMPTGSPCTSSGSYKITSGCTLAEVIVVLRPFSVCPRIPVASDPA